MRFLKYWRRFKYPFIFDKRKRFAATTVVLTSGLFLTQLIWEDYRFFLVAILAVLSYLLSAWSLHEDIKGGEWLLLFILPVAFTTAVSLFYFLLPARWIIRLVVAVVFAIGTYATLLVENIYNVAAIRSIGLLRAAYSIGLLLTLVVVFLSANIVYSLRLYFWQNMVLLGLFSAILALQSFWSVSLSEKLSKNLIIYSLLVGLGIGEAGVALSFWPVAAASYSLFMTAAYYALVGVIQQYFLGRLFINAIREYILVFLFTAILTFLAAKWG